MIPGCWLSTVSFTEGRRMRGWTRASSSENRLALTEWLAIAIVIGKAAPQCLLDQVGHFALVKREAHRELLYLGNAPTNIGQDGFLSVGGCHRHTCQSPRSRVPAIGHSRATDDEFGSSRTLMFYGTNAQPQGWRDIFIFDPRPSKEVRRRRHSSPASRLVPD